MTRGQSIGTYLLNTMQWKSVIMQSKKEKKKEFISSKNGIKEN